MFPWHLMCSPNECNQCWQFAKFICCKHICCKFQISACFDRPTDRSIHFTQTLNLFARINESCFNLLHFSCVLYTNLLLHFIHTATVQHVVQSIREISIKNLQFYIEIFVEMMKFVRLPRASHVQFKIPLIGFTTWIPCKYYRLPILCVIGVDFSSFID